MDFFYPADVRPKESLRFAYVQEQGLDKSCGYSAAASLLSLYWNVGVAEEDLLEKYAREEIESGNFGLSFSDLARIFNDFGFSIKGVMMNWPQLEAALGSYAPILLHYARPDRHFALALFARDGWIITLDPAMGCELQSRDQFLERWSGAALLVSSSVAKRDVKLIEVATRVELDRHELLERLGP
jgi:uncharacterized protein